GVFPITLRAEYKGRSAQLDLSLQIDKVEKGIIASSDSRTWEDGSVAQSCNEYRNPTWPKVYKGSTGDGVYRIQPSGHSAFDVFCDMSTDGGGWTVFQRRTSGAQNFYHGWASYEAGFGSLN